jgi:hypothetical protein
MRFMPCIRLSIQWIAVSVLLAATTVSAEPVTGSVSEPGEDAASAGAVALPLRVGGPAAPRAGYFSPVLGARFELVQIPIAGRGMVDGARLIEDPVAGSPLAGKGLANGDLITHLDGDPVLTTGELEAHHDSTTVSWIADQTQTTRTLKIVIQNGKRFADPNNPGPNVAIVGPPVQHGDIVGKWDCSCGAVWTFSQNGNTVTGSEVDAQKNNRVNGTLNGRTFDFAYINPTGLSGHGTFTNDPSFSTMTGTINWQDGTSSTPTLTRFGFGPGPGARPNPGGVARQYTVIGLHNKSNQVINCEIRWGNGRWKGLQLNPQSKWTGWAEGHGQDPQLRDASGQILDLSGTSVTLQGQPTFQSGNAYGVRENNGQIFLTQ